MFYFFAVVWIIIGLVVLLKEAIMPIVGSALVTFLEIVFFFGAIWISFTIGQFIGSSTGVFTGFGVFASIMGISALLLQGREDEDGAKFVGVALGYVCVPAIILVGIVDFIENHSSRVLALLFVLVPIDACYIYTQRKKQQEREWQNQRLELAKRLLRSAHEEEIRKEVSESEPSSIEMRLLCKKHLVLNDDIQFASKKQKAEIMGEWREEQVRSKLEGLYKKELPDRSGVEWIIAKYGAVSSSQSEDL